MSMWEEIRRLSKPMGGSENNLWTITICRDLEDNYRQVTETVLDTESCCDPNIPLKWVKEYIKQNFDLGTKLFVTIKGKSSISDYNLVSGN